MPPNRNIQIRRQWVASNIGLVAAGAVAAVLTMTATQPIRIRGWDFAAQIGQFEPTGLPFRVLGMCEVTRATVHWTDYGLQVIRNVLHAVNDVAMAEFVGGAGEAQANLTRYLTKLEADELGLVLDYGESIRVIHDLEQVGAGGSGYSVHGYFFYEPLKS